MKILLFLVFGFFVGLIARALMPGTQKLGIVKTTLIGAGGSFVGGLIGNLISGDGIGNVHSAGWIGSIIGALVLMMILGRNR
ncbi:MAG TPA: GlsB/YeaQ/YmgE family stress response membrane protein [Polyangiaceae bacterium]|nr:GlsB/YeaQ/YmgE family stress response membrane protein [Polyangiaceae bacterium]